MRAILGYIRERAEEQEKHPFIQWLRNESVPARERLSRWLPNNAGFAMGFRDLNTMVFRYPDEEAAVDPFKRAINHHGDQDGTHWEWYLRDLGKLGVDREMKASEALVFLWNEDTRAARRFMYRICALAGRHRDPILRYCMIMPLEDFARLLFATLANVARTYAKETGAALEYVGDLHSGHEPGELVNQEEEATENMFLEIELDAARRALAMDLARYVCDEIVARWMSNYQFGVQNRVWSPLSTATR